MSKKIISKVSSIKIAGAVALTVGAMMSGCGSSTESESTFSDAQQQKGVFVIIQQTGPDQYKIVDQYENPSGTTRAILKDMNGNEKLLSEEELRKLSEAEMKKVEQGTSRLQQPDDGSTAGGMSLGEIILASAAGAIMGNMIGSMLFNNPNFQNKMRNNPSISKPIKRSSSSFGGNKGATSSKKSGFFGSSNNKKSFGFGG
jgi:hypothetical protein